MRPSFKDYFYFNRTERNGIIGMSLLILSLILFNVYVGDFISETEQDKEKVKSLLAQLEKVQDSIDHNKAKQTYAKSNKQSTESTGTKTNIDSIEFFEFNPNGLSIVDWQVLGLSVEQAEVIKNYESKGGRFRIKADVEKMYTISEEHYQKLKPYILLPDEYVENKNYDKNERRKPKKEWKPIVKDINLADSAELTEVFGIGPYFAGKIVNYREKLGGYLAKNQLVEIWNFSDSMLTKFDSTLIISTVKLRKLNINTADADELKTHPYISWNIANSIVSIREQHGKYKKLDEIKKSVLIDDSLFSRLSPYLKISD